MARSIVSGKAGGAYATTLARASTSNTMGSLSILGSPAGFGHTVQPGRLSLTERMPVHPAIPSRTLVVFTAGRGVPVIQARAVRLRARAMSPRPISNRVILGLAATLVSVARAMAAPVVGREGMVIMATTASSQEQKRSVS